MANVKVFDFVLNTGDFPKNDGGNFSFKTLIEMVTSKNYVGGDFTLRTNLGGNSTTGRLTTVRTYKKGVAGYTTNTVEFELWLENEFIGTIQVPYSDITTKVQKNKYKTTKIKIGSLLTDWQDKLKTKRQQQHKQQQQKEVEEQGIKNLLQQIKDLKFELSKTQDDLQNALDDVQIEKDRSTKALAKIKQSLAQEQKNSINVAKIAGTYLGRGYTLAKALSKFAKEYPQYAEQYSDSIKAFYEGFEK